MKFLSVHIENFGAIGEANVLLEDRGLVLIQGENRDDPSANSNGAGKSTVIEAISWALYGATAKGVSGDKVINRKAGKGTWVAVTLQDGDTVYYVHRYRKHPKGKNSAQVFSKPAKGGATTDLTLGTDKLTQDVIDKIMGCSYDVFTAAVYAGQEAIPDLPAMTDKQLKVLIEEAAGIDILEEAHVLARARHNAAKTDLDEIMRQGQMLQAQIDAAATRVADAEDTLRRWGAERDARVIDMESEARALLVDAKAAKEVLAEMDSVAQLDAEEARLKKTTDKIERQRTELRAKEGEVAAAQSKAARSKAIAERAVADVQRKEAELVRTHDGAFTHCGACGRPHDEASICDARSTIEAEIVTLKASAREAIASARTDAESVAEAQRALGSYRDSMIDASDANALTASLASRRAKRQAAEATHADIVRRATAKIEAIKNEKAKTCPYEGDVEKRKADHDKLRAEGRDLAPKIKAAKHKVAVAAGAVEVYSPKGVRSHILDTVTPYLNERTGHYLGSLADGRIEAIWQTITFTAKGEPRENFTIEVNGNGGFQQLSGGEKRKVRLACALALQDLVATRATKPIDLWIGDEIDAALDVSGLERLMNVLEDKARERGTVLVVSHSDLRDWIRETITVVKERDVARVET